MFAGRYETFERLGRGGYGTVYRAHDHNLGRELALKLFHQRAEVLALHEARILTHLEGDHILRVFNADVHQDVPFLATSIAAQGSTEDHLGASPGVRPDLVLKWLRHLLVGLRVTHNAGLLHRDITPSNLFLDSTDHARLGDFGVATNQRQDGSADPAGNPLVRSPESLLLGIVTRRSDIWAVGVSGWRLLTGMWPFEALTEAELFQRIADGSRVRLRDQAPHVPQRLALALERAIDPDPANRYETAEAMDDELSRIRAIQRIWVESPQQGQGRHWVGESTRGKNQLEVAAHLNTDGGWEITTRYAATGRRLSRHCLVTRDSQLLRRLRVIFDSL
jgi:serine/threonine protein kinase